VLDDDEDLEDPWAPVPEPEEPDPPPPPATWTKPWPSDEDKQQRLAELAEARATGKKVNGLTALQHESSLYGRFLAEKADLLNRYLKEKGYVERGAYTWALWVQLLVYSDVEGWVGTDREARTIAAARAFHDECSDALMKNEALMAWQYPPHQQGFQDWMQLQADPPLVGVWEHAQAVGTFGGMFHVGKKSWGKFLGFRPLAPEDPYHPFRWLFVYPMEGNPWSERCDQRMDLKRLLKKDKALVGMAMGNTQQDFLRMLAATPGGAAAILDRVGVVPAQFWRLVKGTVIDKGGVGHKAGRYLNLTAPHVFGEIEADLGIKLWDAEEEVSRPRAAKKKAHRKVDLNAPGLFDRAPDEGGIVVEES
jgi:hypothetical protein